MSWAKLPAIKNAHSGCLTCGPKPTVLPISKPLAVGFGIVTVTRDGERIWSGDDPSVWIRRFERRASVDADHDWRVEFYGPLWDGIYQRQGEREWVLVEQGLGFA